MNNYKEQHRKEGWLFESKVAFKVTAYDTKIGLPSNMSIGHKVKAQKGDIMVSSGTHSSRRKANLNICEMIEAMV